MATHHIKVAAGLVFGLGLAAAPAFAQSGAESGSQAGGQYGSQAGGQYQGQAGGQYQGQQGAQPGGQEGFGARGQEGAGSGAGAYGAYNRPATPNAESVPQFWIADASLFIGNAANAAHTLSVEEGLDIQAPQVLGDQASFLLAATNRAISSLVQLQQNAEQFEPTAVPAIRMAVSQLTAAKAMGGQAAQMANAGVLGPPFTTNVRSALAHLAAAERELQTVGRTYNAQHLTTASVCSASRGAAALGVGISGTGSRNKAKEGTQRSGAPSGGTGNQGGAAPSQQGGAAPQGTPEK